jgi:hypothetical protein
MAAQDGCGGPLGEHGGRRPTEELRMGLSLIDEDRGPIERRLDEQEGPEVSEIDTCRCCR